MCVCALLLSLYVPLHLLFGRAGCHRGKIAFIKEKGFIGGNAGNPGRDMFVDSLAPPLLIRAASVDDEGDRVLVQNLSGLPL